jgi:hypothetical protein
MKSPFVFALFAYEGQPTSKANGASLKTFIQSRSWEREKSGHEFE